MCGITGLILKSNALSLQATIASMTSALRHRGPDGEGYLLAGHGKVIPFAGNDTAKEYLSEKSTLPYIPTQLLHGEEQAFLAFGHRRLSVIDVTTSGHQPMCESQRRFWITYNGELYNYIELKKELKSLGHSFQSGSDTEVLLCAYKEWGTDCVKRFNGMWAFCIYDSEKNTCFASRDRLGVKPFYYVNNKEVFAFASEQKSLVKGLGIRARPRPEALREYLLDAALEQRPENFFEEVMELWPGYNLLYNVKDHSLSVSRYFHLSECISSSNEHLSDVELAERIRGSLETAVKLRLRSDVEVGNCLSGGIDSSALALLMSGSKPLSCFTAVFPGHPFNEEKYAELVSNKISARHYKVEPTLAGLVQEIDNLVYSQDVPIWDSSTYAQFKVMELARINQIKVVLDGQGADELFAGYHHHFIAKWNGLLKNAKYLSFFKDVSEARKTFSEPFVFYLKQRIKGQFLRGNPHLSFFKSDFVSAYEPQRLTYLDDVNVQLLDDIYRTRLKSFLKCEDRCGMWHSVESRTPFSDDTGLFSLMFSFDGSRKIQKGASKYLLREAMKDSLPGGIYNRYDKKGFETPMQQWMRELRPMMLNDIRSAGFDFLKPGAIEKSDPRNEGHNRLLFRLFVLSRWQKVFA
jgi:asparagine synthase (glutamine-hydrolysing)